MDAGQLAADICGRARNHSRFIVAIAGPPASGKSTLAELLVSEINALAENAALLAMDGFHLDNAVLHDKGLFARKGAPETFDSGGFRRILTEIRSAKTAVYAPVFDRERDLSRAAATEIGLDNRIIVAEGNYLLLDDPPWTDLADLIDLTVYLRVDEDELERRLIERWRHHGHDLQAAQARARGNDMVNAKLIRERSRTADIVIP